MGLGGKGTICPPPTYVVCEGTGCSYGKGYKDRPRHLERAPLRMDKRLPCRGKKIKGERVYYTSRRDEGVNLCKNVLKIVKNGFVKETQPETKIIKS